MYTSNNQRIALITGAGHGIGRAIALRLAQLGFDIAVHYGQSDKAASAVVESVRAMGRLASAFQCDLRHSEDIEDMFARIDDRFGRLDVLINSAGVVMRTPLETLTTKAIDDVFDVNVKGTIIAAREAAKRLPIGGCIVNVSSSRAHFPAVGTSAYAASKGAVELLTAIWAKELGTKGIRVNAVAPGPAVPGMFEQVPEAMKLAAQASSPFSRIGTADEIAAVVTFLCGEDARWITGQTILVNGGGAM